MSEGENVIAARGAAVPADVSPLGAAAGKLANALERVNKAAAVLATVAIFAMTASTMADVSMRWLVNQPILGVTELNELLMVFAVYLAIAYTQTMKGHVLMELLVERVPSRVKVVFRIIAYLLVIAGMLIVIWSTGEQAIRAWVIQEYRFGSTRFPLWPSKALVPLGLILLTLQLLVDVVRDVVSLSGYGRPKRPAELLRIEQVTS